MKFHFKKLGTELFKHYYEHLYCEYDCGFKRKSSKIESTINLQFVCLFFEINRQFLDSHLMNQFDVLFYYKKKCEK